MKFKQYLNEEAFGKGNTEDNIRNYLSIVAQECRPFIDDWFKSNARNNFLQSGRQNSSDGSFFFKKAIRQDRRPMDTPPEVSKAIDDWFQKKFGVRARSQSIFCTFRRTAAYDYGTPYIIFPIGKYKAIYSDTIDDLYAYANEHYGETVDMGSNANSVYKPKLKNFHVEDDPTYIKKLIDKIDKEGGYKEGIKQTYNEVMVICKEAYFLYSRNNNDDVISTLKDLM